MQLWRRGSGRAGRGAGARRPLHAELRQLRQRSAHPVLALAAEEPRPGVPLDFPLGCHVGIIRGHVGLGPLNRSRDDTEVTLVQLGGPELLRHGGVREVNHGNTPGDGLGGSLARDGGDVQEIERIFESLLHQSIVEGGHCGVLGEALDQKGALGLGLHLVHPLLSSRLGGLVVHTAAGGDGGRATAGGPLGAGLGEGNEGVANRPGDRGHG
mmetsp:Transcript_23682/g.52129  ORF Transcript_23682/g.52129 Transcript_23682/m.52129 type:complete len:212 (-) Transcript_23682:42-677(-)